MEKQNLQKFNKFKEVKFSERLKELRKDKLVTQEELAHKIGYNRTAVSHWENKSKEPSYATLCKIALLFNVTVDYLLGMDDFN